MSDETQSGAVDPLGRWVYSTSDVWRTLEILGPFVPALLALKFVRDSSPFFFIGVAAAGLSISGYGYVRGRDYELVIEPNRIRWGWVTSRVDRIHVDLDRIALVRFRRWHTGAGAVELRLNNGAQVLLPSQITEKSTTASQAIVDRLRVACPKATIEIV